MNNEIIKTILAIALFIFAIFSFCLAGIFFYNPFSNSPYFCRYVDITRRRLPDTYDLLEEYLLKSDFREIENFKQATQQWKDNAKQRLEKEKHFKTHREKQFNKANSKAGLYYFYFTRYHKGKGDICSDFLCCSYKQLLSTYIELQKIGFECTTSQYYAKNQRELMTKQLRYQIMKRDNYTCKICGKCMPNGNDIHIDHIIPISKGGKTVPSNLQVLCSKCNLSKSNKIL